MNFQSGYYRYLSYFNVDLLSFQDSKQDFRKMRENCEQENYINIRKQLTSVKYNKNGSSILTSRPSPPIITHTAPTPQDSPNTTFDTSYKDLISRDIYNKRLSFSSIDKCLVSMKSIHFLLNKLHNYISQLYMV